MKAFGLHTRTINTTYIACVAVWLIPSMVAVQKIVKEFREEEKKIAVKGNRLGLHFQKWEEVDIS